MALPILTTQPATNLAKPEQKDCRVFVSYSHKDFDDARQFMDYFKLQSLNRQNKNLSSVRKDTVGIQSLLQVLTR